MDNSKVAEVDNYDKLGYGFCVFCDPGQQCQDEFAAYQKGEQDGLWDFVGDWTDVETFTSVE